MQLKQIPRDALLKPLQAVSGIVERRHTLPILANVLLENRDGRLYVTATDLEMQITAHSELSGKEPQATTVAARKMQDLLRALPEDALLTVDGTANRMTLRAGRSRFNLQTLPATDYPRIGIGQDQVQALTLPQRESPRVAEIGRVRDGPAGHPLLPQRHAARRSKRASLQAVATDGHRLSWASIAIGGDYERQEVILPRKTVLELGKLLADSDEPLTLDVLANQVRFRFANIELVTQGRRRQVSGLQPRHPRRGTPSA